MRIVVEEHQIANSMITFCANEGDTNGEGVICYDSAMNDQPEVSDLQSSLKALVADANDYFAKCDAARPASAKSPLFG